MDRVLYVAASGASETMNAQAVKANNLANVATHGFRAQMLNLRAMPVYGTGYPSRVYAASESPGNDLTYGGVKHTDSPLDVAIQGDGWFAVQGFDGVEGYTRRGDFQRTTEGILINGNGNAVIGDGGVINVPEFSSISVAGDGTISYTPKGAEPGTVLTLAQLKLVNPNPTEIYMRDDGLFALKSGLNANADISVGVMPGAIEGSNVNPVGELIDLMILARNHELDVKIMKKAEENDQVHARIISLS